MKRSGRFKCLIVDATDEYDVIGTIKSACRVGVYFESHTNMLSIIEPAEWYFYGRTKRLNVELCEELQKSMEIKLSLLC